MRRFDLEWTGSSYMQIREMEEHELGDWVRWEDVEAELKKVNDACEPKRCIACLKVNEILERAIDPTYPDGRGNEA